jgi:hypothetical protein
VRAKWECGTCTMSNEGARTRCGTCDTQRPPPTATVTVPVPVAPAPAPPTVVPAPPSTPSQPQPQQTQQPTQAQATQPQQVQGQQAQAVQPVQRPVTANVRRNEPWECSICTMQNEGARTRCATCDSLRPPPPAPPSAPSVPIANAPPSVAQPVAPPPVVAPNNNNDAVSTTPVIAANAAAAAVAPSNVNSNDNTQNTNTNTVNQVNPQSVAAPVRPTSAAPSKQQGIVTPSPAKPTGPWICPTCQGDNDAARTMCHLCSTDRVPRAPKQHDGKVNGQLPRTPPPGLRSIQGVTLHRPPYILLLIIHNKKCFE